MQFVDVLLFVIQGYREDEGLNLESDADEQLLIYIPFTTVIKLHSIVVEGPEEEGKSYTEFIYSQSLSCIPIYSSVAR